ncbi:MAG: UDP-N-acetylglucosamine 1-carboxyvinyltransferase [Nitrospirae bacterium]|nr:UDP-N-acetylglucosamine 1-carboxyvinyltransferase [Nitrospirota bacterium]MBF0541266.1 UDP-N-acetylglucosamine 1-carboxyvinyltransferase [Nitrospirota bacterium]
MPKLIITGGRRLSGTVEISGAKNAVLPIMTATILSSGVHVLHNIPDLIDVSTMSRLLETFGAKVNREGDSLIINTEALSYAEAPYELVAAMRASVLALGPMLTRYGMAKIALPGGCRIGARPINLHLLALEKMGAKISLQEGYVVAKADKLKGTDIFFETPTVTGTENIMMAAVFAEGITRLNNSAMEPEVKDLADALNTMGAKIKGGGEGLIEIEGVARLNPLNYRVIPDRIETGTFISIAGATNSDILIKKCEIRHLDAVIDKMKEVGLTFKVETDGLRVIGPERLKSANIKTLPYPGFPTDMQAQFMVLMALADGISIIKETIFENRFMHVPELQRMGACIDTDINTATVKGINKLTGVPVVATDIRASASLIVAGLAAEGTTIIDKIFHIDRGYDKIENKISMLGGDIKRDMESN